MLGSPGLCWLDRAPLLPGGSILPDQNRIESDRGETNTEKGHAKKNKFLAFCRSDSWSWSRLGVMVEAGIRRRHGLVFVCRWRFLAPGNHRSSDESGAGIRRRHGLVFVCRWRFLAPGNHRSSDESGAGSRRLIPLGLPSFGRWEEDEPGWGTA
jgi:hypothetical protein